MPSVKERTRNNVRAGIFVTLTLAAAMVVIFLLSDIRAWFGPGEHQYTAMFPVETGVKNLKSGAEVRVGGFPVGRVTDVQLVTDVGGDTAGAPALRVDFEMQDRIDLYDDALVTISSALVGEAAWIDITDLGGGDAATLVADGGTMDGFGGTGTLLDSVFGPEAASIQANASRFMDFAGNIREEVYGKYDADVEPILADIKAITGDLRDNRWPQWAQRVSDVMDWTATATENIDTAIAEGSGLMTDGRELVRANRPKIDAFIDKANEIGDNVNDASVDVKDLARRVNEASPEILAKVDRVFDTGQQTLDETVALIEQGRRDYEGWASDLGLLLGNAMLTSQQLKLASAEIRRSPWKLLYRPTADELEHELLYEAARSYALAVTDLRAATESTERLFNRHGERLQNDPAAFEQVKTRLTNAMGGYENAQAQLLQILNADP